LALFDLNQRWSVSSGVRGACDSEAIGADQTATVKQAKAMVMNDRIIRKRMAKFSNGLELGWREMGSHASTQNRPGIQFFRKFFFIITLGPAGGNSWPNVPANRMRRNFTTEFILDRGKFQT
jgi:hypothetical protein